MIKQIEITYSGTPDLEIAEKKSLTENAMVAAIMLWHRRYLAGHFYVSAESKYGYTKRKAKYIAAKKKRFGHTDPLKKTGRMQRELKRRLDTRTYNFKKKGRARGTMWARVLNLYSKPSAPHDIKRELVEMTDREVAQLMRTVRKGVETRFKQSKNRKKTTVGR